MRRCFFIVGLVLSVGVSFSANAEVAKCSDAMMAKIREKGVEGNDSVRVNCHVSLNSKEVITKKIILEGAAASGVNFDCQGARIEGDGDVLVVQSKKLTDDKGVISWQRPEDINIRNCEIHGSVRIRGMSPNGEGEFLRESSRIDGKHTARAQAAAPTRITLDKLKIVADSRIPLYVAPGSTFVTLKNSHVTGQSTSVAIYLDAESANNVIQNNKIDMATEQRELVAVDASAKNKIVGNRFSSLSHGGIYLYRNCGEGGTVRHQSPQQNQIINNVFYYKNYKGGNPSVFVASRNGNRGYCNDDSGFPWGSSVDNKDFARNNVIAENQIYVLDPSDMIRVNDSPNVVVANQKISAEMDRPSSCYVFEEARLLASGKSTVLANAEGREPVCSRVVCNDGILSNPEKVACPESKIVDFSCKVTGNSSGCSKSVSCPVGYVVQDAKAACDLEMDSVSTPMADLPWGRLAVERASDHVNEGACVMENVKISSGNANLDVRGLKSVKVHCNDKDKNGGDCEIKGQLRCVP